MSVLLMYDDFIALLYYFSSFWFFFYFVILRKLTIHYKTQYWVNRQRPVSMK